MILRALAVVVALACLGASAHALIAQLPQGYSSPYAIVTLALTAGIAVGALAIGAALEQRRRALACVIGLVLICGEAFGLIATAERIVAQRDATQTTITAAHADRDTLVRRLQAAEQAHTTAATSDRLRAALAAKAAADKAVLDKSAERTCAANCRALLEQQVTAATDEIAAARREIDRRQADTAAAVTAARAALEGARVPPSATPLADRLGIAAWQLDVIAAVLGSLAVNGLAAALLAFAGHGGSKPARIAAPSRVELPPIDPARLIDATPPPARMRPVNVKEHAAKFGVECLAPASDGYASLDAIKARYLEWCADIGVEPLADAAIGAALADLIAAVGLRVEDREGRLVVAGVAIKHGANGSARLQAADGRHMRDSGQRGQKLRTTAPAIALMRASS